MKTNLRVKQPALLANDTDKHRFCLVLVLSKTNKWDKNDKTHSNQTNRIILNRKYSAKPTSLLFQKGLSQ